MTTKVRILSLISALIISVPSVAVEKNFDGKLGGAYAPYPEHLGLSIGADYLWILDPYFAAGIESGMFYVKWEEKRGQKTFGSTTTDVKALTNAYVVPMLGLAQLRLPNIREKTGILPYLTVGLGASVMFISYSDPRYTDTSGIEHKSQTERQVFGGFTWETLIGAAYSPAGSKIDFLIEAGYMGSHLYHGNDDINMSRAVMNLGVRFAFDK